MRHSRMIFRALGALALLAWAGGTARAQVFEFTASDWLTHRADQFRSGGNGDPGIGAAGKQLRRVYVWPPTADMPAEMVVDNDVLPPPVGSQFAVAGTWNYPPVADRTPGAWPFTAPDATPDKLGDYVWAEPRGPDDAVAHQKSQAQILADIGISTLSQLPDLGTTVDAAAKYKQVNDVLDENHKTNNVPDNTDLEYVRWTFSTKYPLGTFQGKKQISYLDAANNPVLAPLAPNQRYAIFIRFPNSGTTPNGAFNNPRPNVDHVMVRVSWGADVNDPTTSRIFMLNFGQTGGYWMRIRTGAGDDRFFPYDGVNPLRVTLYTRTPDLELPDKQTDRSIIVADAVRLMPEALRGDIHAPAASARLPLPGGPAGTRIQRTYFGRDETTGPIFVKDVNTAGNYPPNGFTPIPFDPTKPAQTDKTKADYNPIIGDPSSSLRTAVFYCLEDDVDQVSNKQYGKLIWRYVARSTPVQTTTVDDSDPAPYFTASNLGIGWIDHNPAPAAEQAYGTTYKTATVTDTPSPPGATPETAVWQQSLPYSLNKTQNGAGETYSIFVWIPAGDPALKFAHNALYTITTDQGDVTVQLDQRNTDDTVMARQGMWRRLASGIRFPVGAFNGNPNAPVAKVTLSTASHQDFTEDPTRVVVADAIQFVAESQTSNSVVAAPAVAHATWPNGTVRNVVYFATTDGHVWALDAMGAGGNSTLTTAYWVYPSISNPNPGSDTNGNGVFDSPGEDPNYKPDDFNTRDTQGIDGDLLDAPDPANPGKTVPVAIRTAPALGPFTSSPLFVRRWEGDPMIGLVMKEMVVVGNMNGRIYAFDPCGRVDTNTNDVFTATFASGDNPGIPGTTRRWMTWPTVARDKWLRVGGTKPGTPDFSTFTDDPGKIYFAASIAAPIVDPTDLLQPRINYLIAGAGDGHVYAIDIENLSLKTRISNSHTNQPDKDGAPRWMYPDERHALAPINYPGSLIYDTFDGSATPFWRYVFSSGGRVYALNDVKAFFNEKPGELAWVYPFTATPPGNPAAGDLTPEQTDFTAPAVRNGLAINGGKYVAFVANRDGRIFAIDANAPKNTAPNVIWQSLSQGPARSSVTFLNNLMAQTGFSTASGPALFLPSDTGGLIGVDALQGRLFWSYYDAAIGGVPLPSLDNNPNAVPPITTTFPYPTSFAWRGADAITANTFVYEGDEGNQDTGEMNGQFRAYGSQDIGMVTPDEPDVLPGMVGAAEMRLVDLWNAHRDDPGNNTDPTLVWEDFNSTNPPQPNQNAQKSPYNERVANHQKPNTQGNFVVYEWGDTVYAAAWGFYLDPSNDPNVKQGPLPQVTMTLSSGTTTKTNQAMVRVDWAYNGPPHYINDGTMDRLATPFVAVTSWPLARGNEQDTQTPGRNYTVAAQAQSFSLGTFSAPSFRLFAGQFDPPPGGEPPAAPPKDPNLLGPPRSIVIAHPFALTTRGLPGGVGVGPTVLNSIGWTNNYPVNGTTGDLSEIVANGNNLSKIDMSNNLVPASFRDLVAPLGLIPHGSSILYQGVNNSGSQVPALMIADRSNLYKVGQRLNNVRVARSDLAWGWNPNNAAQQPTGNVMNPLPWEAFPNTVPNNSFDYPDVDRGRAVLRGDGIDMATAPVTLDAPTHAGGVKTLNPTRLDLVVTMPRYQPANVNRDYFAIDGSMNPGMAQGLLAPMNVATGSGVYGTGLQGLMAPSAGYYGTMVVFIDSNGDAKYQGTQAQRFGQLPPAINGGREEVFRQFAAAAAVPPDVHLRTEESTVDLGNVPHAEGYSPVDPFAPAYAFNLSGAPYNSVWDQKNTGRQFFLPFTVKNEGNVNLRNVRIARVQGDYLTNPDDPTAWVRLFSDQVDPITDFGIPGRSFFPLAAPAVGIIGIVSSLDHLYGNSNLYVQNAQDTLGGNPETVNDVNPSRYPAYPNTRFWPSSVPNSIADYVVAGNVLGWSANSRMRPTLHKPLPDTTPQTMSIPDVAYGDKLGVLSNLQTYDRLQAQNNANYPQSPRSLKPTIGVAIPMSTPAGTYSANIVPYEDGTPRQWREWLSFYRNTAVTTNGDDDDKLNIALSTTPPAENLMPEGASDPGFRLKATVREARITNGTSPGDYFMLDVRGLVDPAFGANFQPAVVRDPVTHQIVMYYTSNRLDSAQPLPQPPSPDMPYFLNYSTLNSVDGNTAYGPWYDWRFETNKTRWWDPLPAATQYPQPSLANQLFPSQASDVTSGNPPLFPGVIVPETMRHASPSIAIAEPVSGGGNPPSYLFWQGVAYKTATSGAGGNRADTRTFYVPLTNGLPPANTLPSSFLNDPALPKFSPKPLIMTDLSGGRIFFLFWHGGAQGRTRLYFNANVPAGGNAPAPTGWSADTALGTPIALQYQSDPTPLHRVLYDDVSKQYYDAIDVIYTGVLANRRLAETMLTRYRVVRNGSSVTLRAVPLNVVDSETLAREGNTNTWTARDIAWVTRDPVTRANRYTDQYGHSLPFFQIYVYDRTNASRFSFPDGRPVPVNGYTQDNNGNWVWNEPNFDQSTQRWTFRSALGGNMIVDTQAGLVSFTGVSPRFSDRVGIYYIPQTMRVNVTRNDSGVLTAPAGWGNDPGFQPRAHVDASGSNSQPVAFIDRAADTRSDNVFAANGSQPATMPVQRLWTFYRKTNSNVTATSTIYYKTMRLMVRLPRGVLRNPNGSLSNPQKMIDVQGARGPYEVDWVRGRVYFTEADEGNVVTITFAYARNGSNLVTVPATQYRVSWGDEISTAVNPGDQPTNEMVLPTDSAVNEGQVTAFKDPFQEKVWVFWASTRFGTTDLYYLTINPPFYALPAQ